MEHQIWSRPQAPQPYDGPERRERMPVLGLRLRDFDVAQTADHLLHVRRSAKEGVGLFITPNIQHVALARDNPEFAAAMQSAQILVADGFPVYRFAQARGLVLPGRVTGREVIEAMFANPEALAGHRGYFVVDSDETAQAIEAWTAEKFPDFAIKTHVPPFGFEKDVEQCMALGLSIRDFNASLLFLCIGAPKSEVFAHLYRNLLPPCWALCVGQSFRLLVGLTVPPPSLAVKLHLEWAWRLMLEPGRMARRYGPAMIGFLQAALGDLRWNHKKS